MGFEGEFEISTPRRWWRGKGWTIPLDDFFEILMFCVLSDFLGPQVGGISFLKIPKVRAQKGVQKPSSESL